MKAKSCACGCVFEWVMQGKRSTGRAIRSFVGWLVSAAAAWLEDQECPQQPEPSPSVFSARLEATQQPPETSPLLPARLEESQQPQQGEEEAPVLAGLEAEQQPEVPGEEVTVPPTELEDQQPPQQPPQQPEHQLEVERPAALPRSQAGQPQAGQGPKTKPRGKRGPRKPPPTPDPNSVACRVSGRRRAGPRIKYGP